MRRRDQNQTGSREWLPAFAALIAALIVLVSADISLAQELPGKIRGYKVYRDKISVSANKTAGDGADASVTIGEPELIDAGLTGVTFELPAELRAAKQSGKVDFLAFHDVKVNGIAVDVEEYRTPFSFRSGELVKLP